MKSSYTPRKFKNFDGNTSNAVAIATDEIYIFDISDHYEIYDFGSVVNLNASSDAVLILNGSQEQPVLKREATLINRPFRSVAIKNIGSTEIAIGEIKLNYSFRSKEGNLINRGFQLLPAMLR